MSNIIISWCVFLIEIYVSAKIIEYISSVGDKMLARVGLYKPLGISSCIGTPIHELGHYIMAKLFRFKVIDTKFFPSQATNNGDGTLTLGYVKTSNPHPFITDGLGYLMLGVAPMFSGSAVILLSAYFLQPDIFKGIVALIDSINLSGEYMHNVKEVICGLGTIMYSNMKVLSSHFGVFIILTICIARHMIISSADMKIAHKGVISLSILVVIFAFIPLTTWYTLLVLSYMSLIGGLITGFCISVQLLYVLYAFIRSQIKHLSGV